MLNPHLIPNDDYEEAVQFLLTNSIDDLHVWLIKAVELNDLWPFAIDFNKQYVSEQLIKIAKKIRPISSDAFYKLLSVVEQALLSWSIDVYQNNKGVGYNAFMQLLYLAGELRISKILPHLIKMAIKNEVVDVGQIESQSHLFLLKTIFSYGFVGDAMKMVAERDINIALYAPVCYSALWTHDPYNGIRYLSVLFDHYQKNGSDIIDINYVFKEFVYYIGLQGLVECLDKFFLVSSLDNADSFRNIRNVFRLVGINIVFNLKVNAYSLVRESRERFTEEVRGNINLPSDVANLLTRSDCLNIDRYIDYVVEEAREYSENSLQSLSNFIPNNFH